MKKLGIITVHCADNYGSVFQAYAMQELFGYYNVDAGLIDYRPKKITAEYRLLFSYNEIKAGLKYGYKAVWRSIILIKFRNLFKSISRKHKFELFRSRLFKYTNENEAQILVAGSDQIWNPDITGGFDEHYFLNFGLKEAYRIAYAVSIGKTLTEPEKHKAAELMATINRIALRERSDVGQLSECATIDIDDVLDPTLMFDSAFWEKLEQPCKKPDKYILFYSLFPDKERIREVNEFAVRNNIAVVHNFYGKLADIFTVTNECFYFEGPAEFLYLIRNADYVITDSFHGTVFSILYNKSFGTFLPPKRTERINNLLNILGMTNNILEGKIQEVREATDKETKSALEHERSRSRKVLDCYMGVVERNECQKSI